MKNLLAIALFLFSMNETFAASLVEYSGTPTVISASGLDVKVAPQAKVTLPDGAVDLKLSGAGIRKKKVAVINVNVYVAASYLVDPASVKTNPLEGVKASKAKVISLTLLRALTGDEIATAFKDALIANKVDINETAIANVFAQMKLNLKAGDVVTLIGYEKKEGGLEKLVVELPADKKIEEEGKDLALSFWKIFFGTPVDAGMAALKAALTGNN